MFRTFILTLFLVSTAEAQFVVAPVGFATQTYGYRHLTPYGVVQGYSVQTRPVWGIVGYVPPPPPIVVYVRPPQPFPLLNIPQEAPEPVEDPTAKARIDDAVKRGDLLVIKPQKNGVRVAGGPMPDLMELPKPIGLEQPPEEPIARSKYLVERAREAFAQDEPGRAAERLQAAIALAPNAALPHFLLAQVHMARGEYPEAVAAIREGMRRNPDWPAVKFDPRNLYPRLDLFEADLKALKKALEAKPDDPALLFLYGYQLFFLGDRTEAAKLFKKAAARTKENAIIERFLLETVS